MQEGDIYLAAKALPPHPCLIVERRGEVPKDTYLATEGQILCKIPNEQAPFVLLSIFYTFNMQYPSGCTNLYSFLEYLFLEITPPKRSKLQHFITALEHIDSDLA